MGKGVSQVFLPSPPRHESDGSAEGGMEKDLVANLAIVKDRKSAKSSFPPSFSQQKKYCNVKNPFFQFIFGKTFFVSDTWEDP